MVKSFLLSDLAGFLLTPLIYNIEVIAATHIYSVIIGKGIPSHIL